MLTAMKIIIHWPPPALSFAGIVISISTGIAAHHWWPSLLVGIGAGLVIAVVVEVKAQRRQHPPD